VKALVMQAVSTRKSSAEDLEAIEKLLDRFRRRFEMTQALSTALLHFVWQGIVIGASLAIALRS
jgi:hypothetical protein